MTADLTPKGEGLPALAGEAASLVGEVHAASLHVQTARKIAKQLGAGVTPVNRALLKQAERMAELADAIEAGQRAGQIADQRIGRPVGPRSAGAYTFAQLGTSSQRVDDARKIRSALYEDGDRIRAQVETSPTELSLRAWIRLGAQAEPTANEWYTPPWLFEQIGLTFDLDVCAPADPTHRTCPANAYLTEADDGLTHEWDGLVWCNPPYASPEPWADRMAKHGDGILLTHMPNNAGWMVRAQWAASSVRLIQSMHFVRPNGNLQRPGYSLMLATYGDHMSDTLAAVDDKMAGPLWTR